MSSRAQACVLKHMHGKLGAYRLQAGVADLHHEALLVSCMRVESWQSHVAMSTAMSADTETNSLASSLKPKRHSKPKLATGLK